ncbi:glutamate-cysteine ligase family protein [Bradyrhizobium sp. BR 1432]|uniref:glutamate-cysteine ligase family protein n=1 Tax=Bradyrhizobium sp. BR 1432 TaxID=3447966 RepID=UPI003EE6D796
MIGHGSGFRFGLEAEFLLVEADSCRPLWHPELRFEELNLALEAIDVSDFDQEGLDLIPLHRKRMPFVVEGYQLPGPDLKPTALLPKGVEIRTPIYNSVEECMATFATLHGRMQRSLSERGYRAATLSFHPIEDHFEGPQNKRRYDHWQWAMEAMTTYGPDMNVSVPPDVAAQLDLHELHGKVNYYAPALTALTVASPLYRGDLWRIRGSIGKSVRTYHRSTIAPAISIHPKEHLRLEFKPLEMTPYLVDYQAYFLLWLALILDERLLGRATEQSRIYDMGQVARFGLHAEGARDRAHEVLSKAPSALSHWGFDCQPLDHFRARLETGRVPADDIIDLFEREQSIPNVLRDLLDLR